MEATALYQRSLDNAWEMVLTVTDGISTQELSKQPAKGCNSMGWILWHMARVEDAMVNVALLRRPQLWLSGGWHQKFGLRSNEMRGIEDTPRQAAAFRVPSRDLLLGYASAVRDVTRGYLKSLTAEELDKKVPVPFWGNERQPRANLLFAVLKETQQHVGQAAYVRGLIRGPEES